ncbi:MAG: biotin/lipoyl-containing protein, partial [Caulobacteraceae bacterium]
MTRFNFRLPDLGEGTAEAEIVAWHVAVGDRVKEDQPLVEVMTDKATVEITSPVTGTIAVRRGELGEMFAVGGILVEFEVEGEAPAVAAEPPPVPNPSGQRNVEAREAPATTPAAERPPIERPPSERPEAVPSEAGDYTFRLPDLGEGTAEAEIVAWHVKPGDVVEEDQPLVEVMTDKATVEITSPVSGRIVSIHGEPGKTHAVGSPLVHFATEADAAAQPTSPAPAAPETTARPAASANAPAFFRSDA